MGILSALELRRQAMNVYPSKWTLRGFTTHKGWAERPGSTGYDYTSVYSASNSYCAVFSTIATDYRLNPDGITGPFYPILIHGAKTISITAPSTVRVTHWFLDSKTLCDRGKAYPSSAAGVLAKRISGDANAYDSSVALGNRTLTVPSGADSVCFCFQHPGGADITDEEIAAVKFIMTR